MARLLATVEQLKERLNVKTTGSSDDGLLLELLEAASESVEDATGRLFLPDPAITDQDGELIVPPLDPVERVASAFNSTFCQAFDARVVTAVVADGVDVTGRVIEVRLRPHWPAHALRLPFPADRVRITGLFGWAEVPASIQQTTLAWAQRVYHEHRARMSDSIMGPDGGVTSYFRALPESVSRPLTQFTVPGL